MATAAATGAVTGFLGVGLLSKVTKVGAVAKALSKVLKANRAISRAPKRTTRRSATSCAVRHSFDAATPVSLADGSTVSIASLEVGDRVLAWDEATGRTGSYPVSAVWVHDDPVTGLVVVDGEAIATTPGHPLFVTGRGWVEASDLQVGDEIPSAAGDPATVEAIRWDRGPDAMYDLTVAVAHTFFVGDGSWLVHNAGPCDVDLFARRSDPGAGRHAEDVMHRRGNVFTVDRAGASARRSEELRGRPSAGRGLDRDEFPPAVFRGAAGERASGPSQAVRTEASALSSVAHYEGYPAERACDST